ncbi:DUF99 family protein [Metallosphaera tengchongensis]|uniref:UPF0215 protein GWK48_05185 n=1 Tax=Metallosphaera tengchongensis TaxID=1532350 RepID=A0A6N0NXT0_9CREN|nr:DUF99 family protein [Metallosphaera tengchongensis]
MLISGVDDGFFPLSYKGRRGKAPLIVTLYEDLYFKDVKIDFITVDGDDGTEVFERISWGVTTIFDGITYAGFNYIVPRRNYILFYGGKPNLQKVELALEKHFHDRRKEIILNFIKNLVRIETRNGPVYIESDLELRYAKGIIERYQLVSKYPEPIRLAHVIGRTVGHWHSRC